MSCPLHHRVYLYLIYLEEKKSKITNLADRRVSRGFLVPVILYRMQYVLYCTRLRNFQISAIRSVIFEMMAHRRLALIDVCVVAASTRSSEIAQRGRICI
jgi:hypothetical protein